MMHNVRVPSRPQENLELIRRILGDDYIELLLRTLHVEESADETKTLVRLELVDGPRSLEIKGVGVGLVDAVFNALIERYAGEYQSLHSIEVADYRVEANIATKTQKVGLDSLTAVFLSVLNSEGKRFDFSDESRSVSRSSARAVVAAVEYFVNAERAFITLHRARLDAKERKRADLVTRYTREMSEVVKSTSFAEVIERLKE